MPVPDAFVHMVRGFHQDMDSFASSEDELIAILLNHLGPEHKAEVRAYLDELLARNPTGAELQQVWRDADPDWYAQDDEELRRFLGMIRDRLPPT